MMTLMVGEEKSAKPRPRVASITMINVIEVVAVMLAAMARPVAQRPIHMFATEAAEKRSASSSLSSSQRAAT